MIVKDISPNNYQNITLVFNDNNIAIDTFDNTTYKLSNGSIQIL